MNSYLTISEHINTTTNIKGSKFISLLYPCATEEFVKTKIKTLKKEHPSANHICYAFRIVSEDTLLEKTADDGEPNGSAGLPILRALQSAQLINIVGIVIRYFGGTKLGVSGLIAAYGNGILESIAMAKIIEKHYVQHIKLFVPYNELSYIESFLKKINATVDYKGLEAGVELTASIRKSDEESLMKHINSNYKIKCLD